MLLYLTHKGGSIRKAYPKSRIFALAEKRALSILPVGQTQTRGPMQYFLVFGYDVCIKIGWYVGGAKGPLPDSKLAVPDTSP